MGVPLLVVLYEVGLVITILSQIAKLLYPVPIRVYVGNEAVVVTAAVNRLHGALRGRQVGRSSSTTHIKAVVIGKHNTICRIIAHTPQVRAPDHIGEVVVELDDAGILIPAAEGGVKCAVSYGKIPRLRTGGHINVAMAVNDNFAASLIGIVLSEAADRVQTVIATSPDVCGAQKLGADVVELGEDDIRALCEKHGGSEHVCLPSIERCVESAIRHREIRRRGGPEHIEFVVVIDHEAVWHLRTRAAQIG